MAFFIWYSEIKTNILLDNVSFIEIIVLYLLMFNNQILETMKNHKLTPAKYLKAIELGYYEPIKCISVFKKIVKHYKVCGRTEKLLIDLS